MTTSSLRAPSLARTTTSLIDHAHQLGIRVWSRRHTQGRAHWSAKHRSIWLDPSLTEVEARSLLAHELGHAFYGDDGPQPGHIEARAWRFAAELLIPIDGYVEAELLHGQDRALIADYLGVTREVIDAHQSILRSIT